MALILMLILQYLRMMSQVPFSPHMMGHMDEQGRKKLQGKIIDVSALL